MILKHPTLEGVTKSVPDAQASRWEAAGWQRAYGRVVVSGERGPEMFAPESSGRIVPQSDEAPCPTCGAVGDEPCVTFHSNQPTRRHSARGEITEPPLRRPLRDQGQRPDERQGT